MKLIGLIFLVLFCKMVFMTSRRDVCILGSGASGMSAAVFLKDKGYDVVVLEKDGEVGGHCETFYFTPPSPDLQNWLELGVQVFPDTALENATGIGNWTLGSREFAQRFLPENSTIAYAPNVTNYGFDFIHQYNLGRLASSPPTQDYIDAFIRFNTILDTYPWLDNVHFPDPIPQELLVPFSEFTDSNNLTAIESFFFPLLYFGGMGNYNNITTLYALQNLRKGITSIYTNSSYGFTIKGGCTKIYEGISEYLGEENILLNVQDMKVTRSNNRTSISFGQSGKCSNSTLRCKNLIVAFPQLLNQLDFIDLREEEKDIFKDVIANNYYNFGLNVNGPIADNTSFNLASVDIQSPDGIPPFPNILALRREIEYGPAVGYAYADEQKSICYMQHLVDDFLRRLPPSLLNETTIFEFDYHFYQAHFTVEALNTTPTPYTRLDQLQGKRNTYWTGALFSFAETASIWQKTKDLIDQHFPNKQ